ERSQESRRRLAVRPRLEALEDRAVPSALHLVAADLNDVFTSRHAENAALLGTMSPGAADAGALTYAASITEPQVAAGLDAILRDLRQRPAPGVTSGTVQVVPGSAAGSPSAPAGIPEATPPTVVAPSLDSTSGRADVPAAPPAANATAPNPT